MSRSASLKSARWGSSLEPDPAEAPPRDIKKLVLVIGLGALSWVATYVGMLELIEANMGDLPIAHKVIIGFSVAMLMTMIVWLLDQIFSPVGFTQRVCYIAGYLFLSIISVGFGFGFYWKVLESRGESARSAESAVTGVQSSLNAASTRLEQLNATLVQLANVSREKAEIERAKGTSCPNSKPGDGPRRKMRDDDAARFQFASDFVSGRVTAVKADMSGLDGDLDKILKADPSIIDPKTGTRNDFMKALGRKLDMTVSSFNALRSDPQLKQLRLDLTERADKSTFGDPKSGGFVCPDQQLSQALKGAALAIQELPVLEKPTIAAVEGSEATIEAFRRLTTTFYGLLSFKLPPSADELRELQKKAMQSVEQPGSAARQEILTEGSGLSKRDYVPLAVAIFVDVCLLLVSINRPAGRLQGLMPKMREAERGPMIEILSRFNDIHRDERVRENFELFRHVVFDLAGAYYVAVPLDAPPEPDPRLRDDMRVEVQLLANLFTSFEKDRIFKRTWTPLTRTVQAKLRKQGSKFARSAAFRVYRFTDGAWPEIILGAVMGAARRVEAREELEEQAEVETRRTGRPVDLGDMQLPDPSLDEVRARRTERTSDRPQTSPSPRTEPETTRPAASMREDRRMPDPRFAAEFGPHARAAESEFSRTQPAPAQPFVVVSDRRPERDAFSDAANSNTAPAQRGMAQQPGADRINVVLERQTATVSLPREGLEPATLVNEHLEGVLVRLDESAKKISGRSDAYSQVPHGVISAAQQLPTSFRAIPEEISDLEDVEGEIESDASIQDAVAIAGRLRPRVAGE